MKKIFKVSIFAITGLIIIGLLIAIQYWKVNKDYNDKVMKVAFVDIVFGEEIPKIDSVQIEICDSSYSYLKKEIADTVVDKLLISDSYFPCKVSFKYYFSDNRIEKLRVDSFNCAGCSGTNKYELFIDSVNYVYLP